MSSERRSLVVPTLVYLGAVILIGIPVTMVAMAVLTTVAEVVVDAMGFERLPPIGGLLLLAVSLFLGLQLAVEATAVQLGGIEALGRGSPRIALVRYLVVATIAVAVLVAATWIGLSTVIADLGWPSATLGLLVGLAGLFVLYRSSSAFVAGFRGTDA